VVRRYPLESLQQLQQAAVSAGARTLGEREAATARVEAAAAAAREAREAAERARVVVTGRERGRLEAGVARAEEVTRCADFVTGSQLRETRLAAREREVAATVQEARQAEAAARAALSEARAAEVTVLRHRERWEGERERAAERAAEDEALEQWTARHPPGGHGAGP
jgi:hypothetical protein